MSEIIRPLARCRGGRFCTHATGTCTATVDSTPAPPEITEAAKRKACELAIAEGMPNDRAHNHPTGAYTFPLMSALARVLQEHSDLAKPWVSLLRLSDPSVADDIAKTLILPDESTDSALYSAVDTAAPKEWELYT